MNTHETYVGLETAKLLKEAGFDWECKYVYKNDIVENKNVFEYTKGYWKNHKDILLSAPTLAVAQKWLREVKEMHISIDFTFITNEYIVSIHWLTNDNSKTPFENEHTYVIRTAFKTYEEALEAGIKKCLEEYSITDKLEK